MKVDYIEEGGLVYEVRVYSSGNKFWCYKGKRHRLDGPAVEYANGYKKYYINGKLHRLNGPAMEYPNGYKAYWINGIFFKTFEDYKEVVVQYKIEEILNES